MHSLLVKKNCHKILGNLRINANTLTFIMKKKRKKLSVLEGESLPKMLRQLEIQQ